MKREFKPTAIEKVAGSLPVSLGATALGAYVGGPLSSLLPVLAGTLANGRHQQRVEETLAQMDCELAEHGERLDALTDQQYQIIGEAVRTVYQTIEPRKLDYLKRAARNAIDLPETVPQEAVALGRLIRDISADEAAFVLRNFGYQHIHRTSGESEHKEALVVHPDSADGLIVRGLSVLGVLEVVDSMWDATMLLSFSRLAAKLIVLLKED